MKALFLLPFVALLAVVPDTSTTRAMVRMDVYLTPAARASLKTQTSYATLLVPATVDSSHALVVSEWLPAGVTIIHSKYVAPCPAGVDGGIVCPPMEEVDPSCFCASDDTCVARGPNGTTGPAPQGMTLPGAGYGVPRGTGCIPKNCTVLWVKLPDGGRDDGWPTVCPR